ncbi:MAG: aminotransferase class I/II-fold pyridoxal phosphate-dependent enzyme [Clostridiales bacterium]|jgi:aspartate/methionine/tyrosine aminotransferase|nr:aminotransferase class I/II-fold pyridoxal phosphate-dependent enzyme [Clostridiales bacterium]
MKINDFKLEQFFKQYEFTTPYLLCCSDCESMSPADLLALEPGAKDSFLNCRLGYSESPGDPELLFEISKIYEKIDEGGVLEFVGAQEAIFNFMNNALDRGDHMITMFPAYQSTYEICHSIGCEVSNWDLIQTSSGWAADIDALEKLVKPNTKVIALNSPNNPTGFTLSEEQIGAIAAIAERQGIMVFSDEVYGGLELSGNQALRFADIYENAFSLNVFSKAYGLAGLRIGWIASQNKPFLAEMLNFKYYTSICSPVPSQKLAIIAIRHREEIFAKNKRIISGNLLHSDRFFKKHSDLFTYNRPMAGPIAFHKLNSKRSIVDFCEDLGRQKGVLLAYGSLFDMGGNYFRMGYGRKSFKAALDLLDEYVSGIYSRF